MADPVSFVYDGDTEYEGTHGKRAFGIDAPEMNDMAGAEEAKQRWTQLLAENPDATEEVVDTDKYGRSVVRYVTKDGIDLNAQMVREGYADPIFFNGDRSYSREFIDRQNDLLTGAAEFGRDGVFVPPTVQTKPSTVSQEFGTGLERGVMQTGMMFGAAIEAASKALGLESGVDYGAYQMKRYGEKAAALAPEVGSYKDVEDWTTGAKYVAGMFGENIPQFGFDAAVAVGTGGAAVTTQAMLRSALAKRAVGKLTTPVASAAFNRAVTEATVRDVFSKFANTGLFGSQYAQAVGDAYTEQKQNGIDEPTTALIAGLAPAGLDYATTKALLRTASRAAKNGNFNTAQSIINEGLKHTGLQGANEALTELVNKGAVMYHLDNYDMFSDDNIEDVVNATLGGMLFGSITTGSIGGAAFVRNKLSQRVPQQEVEAQNAEALGFDSTQTEIENGVNVITETEDGGHLEQTAAPEQVEQVAAQQAAAAEQAETPVSEQRVETPEQTVARRAYSKKTMGMNRDHVPQTTDEIIGELQALNAGTRNTVLLHENDIPRLPENIKRSLFKGMGVTTTNDGRMFVHHPAVTDKLSKALQASEPMTFGGDTFFDGEQTPVNQQVTPDAQVVEQPATPAPQMPEQVQESPEAEQNQEVAREVQAEQSTGAMQNLVDDEGDSPQDFTQQRNEPVKFTDDYESVPREESKLFNTTEQDVIDEWRAKDAAKKAITTKKANAKRRPTDLTDNDPIAERGELTATAEKRTEKIEPIGEADAVESEDSFNDTDDELGGALGAVVEAPTKDNSLDTDSQSIENAISSSEDTQRSLRESYARSEHVNKTAGSLRKDIAEGEAKIVELRERYKKNPSELLKVAGMNAKAEVDAMKQELAQLNSLKMKRIPKGGLDNKSNTIFVDAGINQEPAAAREIFMPQVVADVLGDWTTQGAGTGNLAQNYLDKISDIVGYMAEQGLKLATDINKVPLAYNGKGGFYYMKDLKKLARQSFDKKADYLGADKNTALEEAAVMQQRVAELRSKKELTPEERLELRDLTRELRSNRKAVEARKAMDFEDTRLDDAGSMKDDNDVTDEYARETNKYAVGDGEIEATASAASPATKKGKVTLNTDSLSGDARTVVDAAAKVINDVLSKVDFVSSFTVTTEKLPKGQIAEVRGVGTLNATVVLDADKITKNYPSTSGEIVRVAVAHELGHIYTREQFSDMPATVVRGLYEQFEKVRGSVAANHIYNKKDGVGFDEFLADQFGLYVNGKATDLDAPARSWFQKIYDALKSIIDSLAPIFGRERLTPNESVMRFYDGMIRGKKFPAKYYDSWMTEGFAVQAAPSRVRSFAANTDMRPILERKALDDGKDFQQKNAEFYDGFLPDVEPYAMTVADVMGKVGSVGRMSFTASKQWLSDPKAMKDSFANFWDFTVKALSPVFGTADGELQRMGAIGKRVAKLYRDAFADTHAMQGVWLAKLHRVISSIDAKTLADFKEGKAGIPTEIQRFLNSFHNQIHNLETNPTVGYRKNYFPRMYNFEEIGLRRDDFVTFLMEQANKKGVPLSEDAAKEITKNMMSGDTMFTEFADVRMQLHGPSFTHGKERTLDFIDDNDLRASGFAHTDPAAVLEIYVSRGIRQAEFLKRFAGWSTIESEVAFQTRTGAIKNPSVDGFLHSMLMDFPLRHPNGKLFSAHDKAMLITPPSDPDFIKKNEKLIAQIEKRGFIRRRSVPRSQGYGYEYFDRNKHLRRYGGIIQNQDAAAFNRFTKIVDAYEGRLGADQLSPQARKLMSNVMAYQNATTMVLSGFASIPDAAGAIFRSRDFKGMADGMQGIYDAIRKESPSSRRKLMADLGFVENQMTTQALLEAMGLHHTTAGARKFNDMLFRINGTRALTNISRVALASVAERFIARHAKAALRGDETSIRYMRELGLTAAEADAINQPNFKFYNHYVDIGDVGKIASPESKIAERIHKAMARFVDTGTVRPNATMRPVWASDPRFMLIWHLKSFMYAYGKVILGGLGREMQARWDETSGTKIDKAKAAAIPALVYAVPVLALSAIALGLRQQVQYEVWGDTAPTERMDWAQYTMEIVKRGGLLGPLEMGYSFIDATTSNRSGISQILGPTASQLEVILSFDAERILGRSVPVASQIPAVREWLLAGFSEK